MTRFLRSDVLPMLISCAAILFAGMADSYAAEKAPLYVGWAITDIRSRPGADLDLFQVRPIARLGAVPWQLATAASAMDFAPDGSMLAYASGGKNSLAHKLGYQVITVLDGKTGYALRRLRSPGGEIYTLRVSPCGKRIAVYKSDCTVAMMDADSGDTLWQFSLKEDFGRGAFADISKGPNPSPGARVMPLLLRFQFSHDGKYLFATSSVRSAWVLDAQTGAAVRRMHEPRGKMMRFSSDGKTMISARDDETVGIWDVLSGAEKKRAVLKLPEFDAKSNQDQIAYVNIRIFCPSDDGRIAVLGTQKRLVVVDLDSGKIIKTLARAKGTNALSKRVMAFSPDGKYLVEAAAIGLGATVRIIGARDLQTRHKLKIQLGRHASLIFSPDGKRFGMRTGHLLRWWDIESGKPLPTESAHSRDIQAVALSPNGDMAATLARGCSVRLWSTRTRKQLHQWPLGIIGASPTSLAFSPDGKLLAANRGEKTALFRCEDGKVLHEFTGPSFQKSATWGEECAVRFSADGKTLAVLRAAGYPSKDRHFQRWDINSGKLLHEKSLDVLKAHAPQRSGPGVTGYNSVAISPDLRRAASLLFSSHVCAPWDPQTGKWLCRMNSEAGFTSLLFNPNGTALVLGDQAGAIFFVDPESGKLLAQIAGPDGQAFPRAFLNEGRILVSEHDNGTTYFWDTTTGKEIRRFQGHRIWACSADGRLAASLNDDNSVSIWDLTVFRDKVIDRWDKLLPPGPAGVAVEPLPLDNLPAEDEPEEAALHLLVGSARIGDDADPQALAERNAVASLKFMGASCYYDLDGKVNRVLFWDEFHRCSFTDEGMAHVGKLTGLKRLELWDTDITDAGMVHVRDLKNLNKLSLPGNKISDAGVANAAGLRNLASVDLRGTDITDGSMASVSKLPHLHYLSVAGTAITDAGLEHLKGLTELDELYLGPSNVTDAGLKHLEPLTKLRLLQLRETEVTGLGFANLKGLTQLKSLFLAKAKVDDAGLAQIAELTSLRALDLSQTKITDDGLARIAKLNSLDTLYLGTTKITDAGLKHLAGLTRLRRLILFDTQVRGPGLEDLKGLTGLKVLVLTKTPLTDDGLQYVRFLPNLDEVYIDDTDVSHEAIEKLQGTRPKLQIRTSYP